MYMLIEGKCLSAATCKQLRGKGRKVFGHILYHRRSNFSPADISLHVERLPCSIA